MIMESFDFDKKDDKELIADYLNGQQEVLAYLINRHLKPVYRFVFGLVNNEMMAEDITQDIFVKVWKNLKKYNPKYTFKTWLFSIARNTSIDYLRKRKDIVFSEFDNMDGDNFLVDTLADDIHSIEEDLSKIQEISDLKEKLQNIPAIYREVLILRYTNDLLFEEIADILRKPVETVKSQHRRGLLHLKRLYTRT